MARLYQYIFMNEYWYLWHNYAKYISAWSLKCHVGSDTASVSTTCDASTVCAKITLDSTKVAAYTCLPETSLTVSGHKAADIKDALDCKDVTGTVAGKYCYCKTDDCNDPKKSSSSSSNSTLKVNEPNRIIT